MEKLCEYFIVVGSSVNNNNNHNILTSSQGIEIENPNVYDAVVLDRYPIRDHSDSTFPNGIPMFCFPVGLRIEKEMRLPTYFTFVTTDSAGHRMYGHNLIFMEEMQFLKQSSKYYMPKCLCILSRHNEFSLNFRSFLLELYRLSITSVDGVHTEENDDLAMIPLERFICNFISEVPLPPFGKKSVIYRIGEKDLYFSRPPMNLPIAGSLSGMMFRQVFECFSLENILTIFSAILEERQILVISSQFSLLTGFCEVFRTFMFPFDWHHVYIPILPVSLIGFVQAPLPFLIGIHADILTTRAWADVVHSISDTVIRVDMDLGNISIPDSYPITGIPTHHRNKLLTRLSRCAPAFSFRSKDWKLDTLPYYDSAIEHTAKPYEMEGVSSDHDFLGNDGLVSSESQDCIRHAILGDIPEDQIWKKSKNGQCHWGLTRVAFLRFFASFLSNYRNFVTRQKNDKPFMSSSSLRANLNNIKEVFREEDFLASKPNVEVPFSKIFAKSQHFRTLLDAMLSPHRQPQLIANFMFFEETIDARNNRRFQVRFFGGKAETPFLTDPTFSNPDIAIVSHRPEPVADPHLLSLLLSTKRKELKFFPRLIPELYIPPRASAIVQNVVQKPNDQVLSSLGHLKLRKESKLSWLPQSTNSFNQTQANDPQTMSVPSDTGYSTFSATGGPEKAVYALWFILYCSQIGRISSVNNNIILAGDVEETIVLDQVNNGQSILNGTAIIENSQSSAEDQLALAFAVLERALKWNEVDEIIYRCLIGACGRCGDVDRAIQVLGMMRDARIKPDSIVYSNLIQAFSVGGNTSSALERLSTLRWEDLPKEAAEASNRVSRRAKNNALERLKAGSIPSPMFQRRLRRWGARADSKPLDMSNNNNNNNNASILEASTPIKKKSDLHSAILVRKSSSLFSESPILTTTEQVVLHSTNHAAVVVETAATLTPLSSSSNGNAILGTPFRKHQLDLPDCILEAYSDLEIDTEREICPNCKINVSDADIRTGWSQSQNDYTTQCPKCKHRFLAFFTVHSYCEDWVGSKGPRTALFCEFVSPWVLIKEVQTYVFHHGANTIFEKEFQNKRPFLFWNIILYCNEFSLPLDFFVESIRKQRLDSLDQVHQNSSLSEEEEEENLEIGKQQHRDDDTCSFDQDSLPTMCSEEDDFAPIEDSSILKESTNQTKVNRTSATNSFKRFSYTSSSTLTTPERRRSSLVQKKQQHVSSENIFGTPPSSTTKLLSLSPIHPIQQQQYQVRKSSKLKFSFKSSSSSTTSSFHNFAI